MSVMRGKSEEEMKQNGISLHPLDVAAGPEPELLCIFGTGDLGRSLGLRLLQSGYGVVYGSRRPNSCGPLPQGAQVMTHAEAAQSSNLIFICVHREHYELLTTMEHHLKGKVLVDLSNNLKKGMYPEANAVYMQRLVPSAAVVKGLNTLSAWALQNELLAGKQVFLCGESGEAKQAVAHLATKLGLTVLDKGSLSAARELEDFPLKLFPEWRLPLSIAVGLSAFFFFYLLIRDVIYAYVEKKNEISYRIMVALANKVFPIVALVMLSLCYLPGAIAAFFQLYRGTKYRRFPNWLDRWMLCRKQMGLVALGFAVLHAIYTFIIPIRYSFRHKLISGVVDEVKNNKTTPSYFDNTEAWGTDSFISLGILGFFLFVLLGLTSLPSVGGSLSWREFNFIQSKLGHLTLFICTAHGYIYGWNKFLRPSTYKWYTPPGYMLCLIVPSVVLVLKLLLLLPCVDRALTRIRQGWERTQPKEMDEIKTTNL
ncbi:metalloreductase STEAP4-like [Poecilia formosa]|uniref:metalloreductase STEAP4-like n=1 Tax=Poecilia formosa TaxID=48698 RepID=UPI0007B8A3CC|nr:PREDICTED: metalloreductase STEAP4-like [Poecilia formosa]